MCLIDHYVNLRRLIPKTSDLADTSTRYHTLPVLAYMVRLSRDDRIS
jgi:hypothetical protein